MRILILIWSLLSTSAVHDIHLSVTEVKRNGDDIEVMSKIFLDDLQKSMGLIPGEELPDDYKGADDLLQRFIDRSLILKLNDQKVHLTLSKTEAAHPAVWATFTVEKVEWLDENVLSVDNQIMTDLFEDQKNIFKVDINGHHDEHIFSSDETIEEFKF